MPPSELYTHYHTTCSRLTVPTTYADGRTYQHQYTINDQPRDAAHSTQEPVVILIGGHGSTGISYYQCQPAIAKQARVIIYDRLGSNDSGDYPSAYPRTLQTLALELFHLLKALHVDQQPLIQVGHSKGGAIARAFIEQYRQQIRIVGLLLIDAAHEEEFATVTQIYSVMGPYLQQLSSKPAEEVANDLFIVDTYAGCSHDDIVAMLRSGRTERCQQWTAAEFAALPAGMAELASYKQLDAERSSPVLGDTPVVVLLDDMQSLLACIRRIIGTLKAKHELAANDEQQLEQMLSTASVKHVEYQQQYLRLSRNSTQQVLHATHHLLFSQPQAVVDAVEGLLQTHAAARFMERVRYMG